MRCFAQAGAGISQKDINQMWFGIASIVVVGRLTGKKNTPSSQQMLQCKI